MMQRIFLGMTANSRAGVAIIIYTYICYACTLLSPIGYMELITTIIFCFITYNG